MSLSGILGALVAGGGKAINENADGVIDERKRQADIDEANATWQTRREEVKADQDELYTKQRADQVSDREDEQAFRLALAKENGKKTSGTQMAKLVSDFDANATDIVKQIDKINSDTMATREDKLLMLKPLYARLDDYMSNNSEVLKLSTLGGVLTNIRKQGFDLFADKINIETTPSEKVREDTETAFISPRRRNNTPMGTSTMDGRDDGQVTSLMTHEYKARTPGILNRMAESFRSPVGQSQKTADYSGLTVRPFN
ncbi:hypothetical protein MACH09_35210 [Vibrio sp. MACH09]|uniref:hypothetical protein n=1 Tax=Vibrio sp. MACH09 TaxID=3025122 RepID=UPI0027911495|nr:hypothetical protein [Vibrio sp. MACH09]GLO63013.1 hypothetical protein MACH09_35210 [Vibrio sp. MACH09]